MDTECFPTRLAESPLAAVECGPISVCPSFPPDYILLSDSNDASLLSMYGPAPDAGIGGWNVEAQRVPQPLRTGASLTAAQSLYAPSRKLTPSRQTQQRPSTAPLRRPAFQDKGKQRDRTREVSWTLGGSTSDTKLMEYDALQDPSMRRFFHQPQTRRTLSQSGLLDESGRFIGTSSRADALANRERKRREQEEERLFKEEHTRMVIQRKLMQQAEEETRRLMRVERLKEERRSRQDRIRGLFSQRLSYDPMTSRGRPATAMQKHKPVRRKKKSLGLADGPPMLVRLRLSATGIDAPDGLSEPFFLLSRLGQDGRWLVVFESGPAETSESGSLQWPLVEVLENDLCSCEWDRRVLFQLMHTSVVDGQPELIGGFKTTLWELDVTAGSSDRFKIVHPQRARQEESYDGSGMLNVVECRVGEDFGDGVDAEVPLI